MYYQVLVIDTAEHRLSEIVAGIEQRGITARGTSSADAAVGFVAHDQPPSILLGDLPDDWARSRYCGILRKLSSGPRAQIMALRGEPDAEGIADPLIDTLLPPIASGYGLAEIAVAHILASARREHQLRYGGFTLDLQTMHLATAKATLDLGPQIAAILAVLMRQPEMVHSRNEILLALPPERIIKARSIDVYVQRLRKAAHAVAMPDPIETIHTRGYRIARQ